MQMLSLCQGNYTIAFVEDNLKGLFRNHYCEQVLSFSRDDDQILSFIRGEGGRFCQSFIRGAHISPNISYIKTTEMA